MKNIVLTITMMLLAALNLAAQTFNVIHTFTNSPDGACPAGCLILDGGILYGTTCYGGINLGTGYGTVYRVNTDGTGYAILKTLGTNGDGAFPSGGLILNNNTLYGTTDSGSGTVFKINTDGTDFAVLANIYSDSSLVLIGNSLFGIAGTELFKVSTDGAGFAILANFPEFYVYGSESSLVLNANTFYGTAMQGWGQCAYGAVFKVNTDGTDFAIINGFPDTLDGSSLQEQEVVLSGGTLYGIATWGGSFGYGTVFKVNTDGTGFGVLKNFMNGPDGANPQVGLVLSGSTLYGVTWHGGVSTNGTVFRINTDGTGYAVLKSFSATVSNINSDGACPSGLMMYNGVLYGTTRSGGSSGNGTVFSLTLPSLMIITQPTNQAVVVSNTATFTVVVDGVPPLSYQWNFNGTNIVGATNSVLTLTNVQFSQAGNYAALVTNAFGSILSSNAMLWIQNTSSTNYTYTTNNGTITITGYTGSGGAVSIPDTINSLPVTTIGSGAFFDCTNLISVSIPNSVTSIGSNAFVCCANLISVTIPDSITNIGNGAFAYCIGLSSVTMGNSITSIGDEMFFYCTSLTNVTIPNSVTSIGNETFFYCTSLTSVAIPNSVTSIGVYAFFACTSLTNVTVPNGVNSIGGCVFYECTNLTSVYFQGNAPSIGEDMFYGDNNTTVYYLPGTTGWGATFGGRPTVLWNPQVKMDASFGVRTNIFGFRITGTSGLVIVLEACTNFANPVWQPVQTNTIIRGSSYFSDPAWTNYPGRFYRLRSP